MGGVEKPLRLCRSRTGIGDVVDLVAMCDLKELSLFQAGFEVGRRRLPPCVQLHRAGGGPPGPPA